MKKDVYNLSKPQEAVSLTVSKKFFENVENIAKENNVSSYSIFLSAIYILLYKYSYQDTLNIILKKHINLDGSFSDFVKNIHKDTKNIVANRILENVTLSEKASPIKASFTYQNISEGILTMDNSSSEFDLSFEIISSSNVFNLKFNINLFKPKVAKSLISHYFFLLKQIVKSQDSKLSEFEMLTPEENRLLKKFNSKKTTNFDNDASLTMFDTNNKDFQVHILDDNLRPVPIGNIRKYLYLWKTKRRRKDSKLISF